MQAPADIVFMLNLEKYVPVVAHAGGLGKCQNGHMKPMSVISEDKETPFEQNAHDNRTNHNSKENTFSPVLIPPNCNLLFICGAI